MLFLPHTRAGNTPAVILGILLASIISNGTADAAIIASDSFLTGGTGNYLAGNINGQGTTGGTTGYFTGSASGSSAPNWTSGSSIISVSSGGLSHPLVANAPSSNDGKAITAGNANTRIQYRDFLTTTPVVSSNYYFSALLRETANSYTGTSYVGISGSRATGGNAAIPNTGFQIGFQNGALSLFYKAGSTDTTFTVKNLVAVPTVNETYMATLHYDVTAGTITPMIYNSLGILVNNPTLDTVTAVVAAADMGAFYFHLTSDFNGTTPAGFSYDELRFGTTLEDVMIPEPSAAVAILAGLPLMLTIRRRKSGRS